MGLEPDTTYVLSFDFRIVERLCRGLYVSHYLNPNREDDRGILFVMDDEGCRGTAVSSFTTRKEGLTYLGFALLNFETKFPERFAYGNVVIDNIRIRRLGAWRRDYDNGIVLCNPTSKPVEVKLEKKYRKIRGKQCPEVNDGSIVDFVTLPPYDGLILLRYEK